MLKLKVGDQFKSNEQNQRAFDSLKYYLTSPPVLMLPRKGKDLKLYILASKESMGSMLV